MVLASSVAGVPFVFTAHAGTTLHAVRRRDWATPKVRILGEFLLPRVPHMPDLLAEVRNPKHDALASALMLHLVMHKVITWRDHAPFDDAKPDDVLAACLTTPTIAKVRP